MCRTGRICPVSRLLGSYEMPNIFPLWIAGLFLLRYNSRHGRAPTISTSKEDSVCPHCICRRGWPFLFCWRTCACNLRCGFLGCFGSHLDYRESCAPWFQAHALSHFSFRPIAARLPNIGRSFYCVHFIHLYCWGGRSGDDTHQRRDLHQSALGPYSFLHRRHPLTLFVGFSM